MKTKANSFISCFLLFCMALYILPSSVYHSHADNDELHLEEIHLTEVLENEACHQKECDHNAHFGTSELRCKACDFFTSQQKSFTIADPSLRYDLEYFSSDVHITGVRTIQPFNSSALGRAPPLSS